MPSTACEISLADRFLRSLKQEMLDKVTDAVDLGGFVTRADADPKADAHAGHVRHLGGGDGEAVAKLGNVIHGGAPDQAKALGTISGGPTRRS